MDEPVKKRVDESWKEQVEREKHTAERAATQPGPAPRPSPDVSEPQPEREEAPEARWDLFISGLAMEALVAMGDMAHPGTRKPAMNLPRAKYLVDLLGILEEKTKGNLSIDEDRLLKDALYQLRMRYLSKTGG
jgi:hypothetical protein